MPAELNANMLASLGHASASQKQRTVSFDQTTIILWNFISSDRCGLLFDSDAAQSVAALSQLAWEIFCTGRQRIN